MTLEGVRKALYYVKQQRTITPELSTQLHLYDLLPDPEVKKRTVEALDYVLFYVPKDEDKAHELQERLTNNGCKGELYDERANDGFASMRHWYGRATIKFFLVSNNIASGIEIMKHKTDMIMTDLKKRDKSIVPIWLVDKYDLDDDSFDALYGLASISGLDPKSSYFERKVLKLRDDPANAAKKRDWETKQLKELAGYLEDMKKHIEDYGEQTVNAPEYNPEQTPVPQVIQSQTVFNVTIGNADKVTTPGPGTHTVTHNVTHNPGPAGNTKIKFTVDASFWEEMAKGQIGQVRVNHNGHSHDGLESSSMETDSQQPSDSYMTEDGAPSSGESGQHCFIPVQATDPGPMEIACN